MRQKAAIFSIITRYNACLNYLRNFRGSSVRQRKILNFLCWALLMYIHLNAIGKARLGRVAGECWADITNSQIDKAGNIWAEVQERHSKSERIFTIIFSVLIITMNNNNTPQNCIQIYKIWIPHSWKGLSWSYTWNTQTLRSWYINIIWEKDRPITQWEAIRYFREHEN